MRERIFVLVAVLTFCFSAEAQQEKEPILVRPVAYDRNFLLYGPHKTVQTFVVEVQNPQEHLLKLIYLPKTDGHRGGKTAFVSPSSLNSKTTWRIRPREPSEAEGSLCSTDNFLRDNSGKISLGEKKEPALRFRATQFDGFVQFRNLETIPCLILDSAAFDLIQ